ncbi:MAG: aminotransferase class V-fold PLP-dependent enzyme [Granulosicoccus sp.]|nr:aminotransferase class V-fold PLP-dependent enzyme [Granulosicoccus sp.]
MTHTIFPQLEIPHTLAAGPGPGNTDPRVLERFAASGVADHMQADVLRGMSECKFMLRDVFGTENTYTFGVAGTGWSGLDAMMSAVQAGDTVVAFVNGTFSNIDGLTLRMKAATAEELAANPLDPQAASVKVVEVPHGESVTASVIDQALSTHKPKWAFMAHWETGSGRINDVEAFSKACVEHGAMGMIDAVSSLGVEDFKIDDYPGVVAWASCPQKGICCLPLTYAPVSFNDRYIDVLKQSGARTFVHHPILEARHWGIVDGQDVEKGTYHRTHSAYAVAAFHEALRLTLTESVSERSQSYQFHEAALRRSLESIGCKVTSNMTSLVVFNLPEELAGREMELVQKCRQEGFGIWPTLSEPVQVRIGILNQLSQYAITDIVMRFAKVMLDAGAPIDLDALNNELMGYYESALAAA